VSSRSFSAYLADVAPEAALRIQSSQPRALVNLADKVIFNQLTEEAAKTPSASEPSLSQPNIDAGSPNAQADKIKQAFEAVEAANRRDRGAGRPNVAVSVGKPAENSSSSVDHSRQISAWAQSALLADPLNARALRILGQIADGAKDEPRAVRFMQASARLSLNEGFAVYWMMQKSFEKRDYDSTLYYADAFLMGQPVEINLVMPTLVKMAESKEASDSLKKFLAKNPPWLFRFFAVLPESVTDARTPLDLLLALKDTKAAPSAEDVDHYLSFLASHKLFDLAYYTWLQFLPPEQLRSLGLVFNGSFETKPTGSPFDWVISPGTNVTIDIVARPDEKSQHALLIEFQQGRVDFRGVVQLIALAPGNYRFNAKYRGNVVGQRGLKWTIVCAGGPIDPIAESKLIAGVVPSWTDTEFKFSVPSVGCRGQYLRLDLDARSASEQFVSGSIWFDEVGILRLADTAQKKANSDH